MRRWPVAVVLVFAGVLALAVPASAEAKFAKVAVPAEGDVTVAKLRLTSRGTDRPRLRLRSRRGIGDLKVTASLRKRGRRSWDALVLVANPRSGTAHSSAVGAVFVGGPDIVLTPVALVFALLQPEVQKVREAAAAMNCQNNLKQLALAAHSNVYGVPNPKKLTLSAGRFFCQVGSTEQLIGAQQQLAGHGLAAPGCFGRVEPFGGGRRELRFVVVCPQPVDGFLFTAQQGNAGVDCLGPPGTFCACGPPCGGLESGCFQGAFPGGTPFTLNVRWNQDVPIVDGALDVDANAVAGSDRDFGLYLFRYTGPQGRP